MSPNFLKRVALIGILVSLAVLAVISSLMLQRSFPILTGDESLESNLGFIVLININIVAVMILGFVVVRNIIRLIVDRRKNILGARLRSRLVLAFISLSLVPTCLLFLVAKGMIEGVFQDWFSPKVEIALESSKKIASGYYDVLEKDVLAVAESVSNRIIKFLPATTKGSKALISEWIRLDSEVVGDSTVSIALFTRNGEQIGRISNSSPDKEPPVNLEYLNSAYLSSPIASPERVGGREFMRVYRYVSGSEKILLGDISAGTPAGFVLVITKAVRANISESLNDILSASDEYRNFKSYRKPLDSSFFTTLIVVTLLIIFGAISVGFFIAKGLTGPIGLLAKGTEQVAHGNLNFHIPEFGDDELTVLVRSFNKMTKDLKETTGELISRRRYIETVLANVGVGVLSIDSEGLITTMNRAAFDILEVSDDLLPLGKSYEEALPRQFVDFINDISARSLRGKIDLASKSRTYLARSGAKHLQIILTKLFEESNRNQLGMVVLVDDVTELDRAQRMSAWQEVAKRMAHEIKNPLTPIYLSAERIKRMKSKFLASSNNQLAVEEGKLIDEATDVIMKQVENLRVLVNEFSQFARLPKSVLVLGDISLIIKQVLDSYRGNRSDIEFVFESGDNLPNVLFDAHQIERVFINLIDNSISAIDSRKPSSPIIKLRIFSELQIGSMIIELTDNGIGVSEEDKLKLFEPYFSRKSAGTGLGLAIVKSVISDHNGFIRVYDAEGGGLSVKIELPCL